MNAFTALDWNDVLDKIRAFATSEPGRERIQNWGPCASASEATRSFQEIMQAAEALQQGFRPHLQSLDLYSMWTPRLKKQAVLKTLEMRDVRHFCLEALALTEALKPVENAWADDRRAALMDASEPLSAIDQILTPSGEIRSDASEQLYRLFTEKERLARDVQQSLDRLVKDHQMETLLQDKYVTTREGRWVLPVRGGMQHHMPGVIHGTSQTKQTVFMEPEKVIPMNNRLRHIEVDIEDEIERLLTDLSHYLSSRVNDFERSRDVMEEADIRFSQAQFAAQVQAAPCEFVENTLELVDVRHPLLQLSGKAVISNTVLLDRQKSILLLSGPNAGGKTVLLKSVGLAAQMARCGLPICATENSKIPFFEDVLIGIGDAQSVDAELSTFAAHLQVLNRASKMKGPSNLILIDEICGSTDPEEGSALARSFIERFAANRVFAVITSHLGPLKAGWKPEDPVLNGSLEYDTTTGRPTYQFISGLPGDSLAIQTARRVGVDSTLIERAVEVLSPATRARLEGLEEIESLKADIAVLQETLRKETQAATQTRRKYEGLVEKFEKEKDDLLIRTARKAEKQVQEAIQQASVDDTFRRHRQLSEIKHQLPEIIKAKPVDLGRTADTAEEFSKKYPPGSKVFVPSLNTDGLVQSTPNAKGEVMILSGSVRLQVNWRDLKPPGKPQNPTPNLVRRSGAAAISLHDEERTLDLRGKTVTEAIEDLEISLDRAATQKEDRIKIIHGHGTDALKKAVRSYLSRSVYVKKWKAGSPDGGGDGVTWAELSDESP
ncbi:MAG TPA: Smr/MutS family protein [Pseudobdellovibrionaceae bacterium]|nr:Smr/MutS family protein [Pseudobdellovibrionaceae bacterium]